jgi:hypothetical protein
MIYRRSFCEYAVHYIISSMETLMLGGLRWLA